MAIMAKDKGGKDFKPVPQGTHVAVCNAVIDCGIQPGGRFKPQRKVYLRFEVPAERVEFEKDGKHIEGPMQIGKLYTLSLSEKSNLRRDLTAWRGKPFTADELAGFDVSKLLGVPCQITVAHDPKGDGSGSVYANIIAIMGMPKGMPKPKAERPTMLYTPEEHDESVFDQLPEWLRKKIEDRLDEEDVAEPELATAREADFNDEIPF